MNLSSCAYKLLTQQRLAHYDTYTHFGEVGHMANAELIRRQLISFSLVSQDLGKSGDPISSLTPFFTPIANDLAGQVFDVIVFRSEMRKRYGINLTRDVTEMFVKRLIGLGLLKVTSRTSGNVEPIWIKQTEHTDNGDEKSKQLDDVIAAAKAFHGSKEDLLKVNFDEDVFLGALMGVLLNQDDALRQAVNAIEGDNIADGAAGDAPHVALNAEEYFASEFIAWTSKDQKEIFDWLAELSGTAIVAEALIEIRTPQENPHIRTDITVYLDAPFLMELLGCSGHANREDAKQIIDTLQTQRIPVVVLEHSISELKGNLNGVLRLSPTQRTGPTAKALLFNEVTEGYLNSVNADPEHFIAQHKISIVDSDKLPQFQDSEYFTADHEQRFYNKIYNLHEHEPARQRDVKSISWIMRRRDGHTSRDVLRSKHILLTRNALLAQISRKFAVDECDVATNVAAPAILARDLAGILWLIVGQSDRQEISKRQLILNCDRARSAAPQIVSDMYETVSKLNPQNAELFWAAVQKPKYLSLTLDAVSGGSAGVNKESSEQTLERIRDDLVKDEREKSSDKMARQKQKFDAEAAMQKLIHEKLEGEASSLHEKNDRLLETLRSSSEGLWSKNNMSSITALRAVQIILIVVLILGVTFASIYGTDFVTTDWKWKAAVATTANLIFLYVGKSDLVVNRLSELISDYFTRRYKSQLIEIAGDFSPDVLIATPVLIEGKRDTPASEEAL